MLLETLKIHLINDGMTYVDPGGAFGLIPRVLWSRYIQPNDDYLIEMANHCLYFEAGGKKIVVDTGLGTNLDAKQRALWHLQRPNGGLIEALGRLGVQPQDVDLVINTHLHADHCAGNVTITPDGELRPTFPNAEYVTQRAEYEDAMRPNERTAATYIPLHYAPLVESGQMRLLDGDTEIVSGVRGIITRGHTRAHMSLLIESGDEALLYACDMACYAVHFERLGWMTAYDVEPLHTLESKRKWQQWALETGAWVCFPHDSVRAVGKLTQPERSKPILEAAPFTYA